MRGVRNIVNGAQAPVVWSGSPWIYIIAWNTQATLNMVAGVETIVVIEKAMAQPIRQHQIITTKTNNSMVLFLCNCHKESQWKQNNSMVWPASAHSGTSMHLHSNDWLLHGSMLALQNWQDHMQFGAVKEAATRALAPNHHHARACGSRKNETCSPAVQLMLSFGQLVVFLFVCCTVVHFQSFMIIKLRAWELIRWSFGTHIKQHLCFVNGVVRVTIDSFINHNRMCRGQLVCTPPFHRGEVVQNSSWPSY